MEGLTEKLAVHAICDTPVCFSIRGHRFRSVKELFRNRHFRIGCISLGKFLRMETLAHEAGIDLLNPKKTAWLTACAGRTKDKIAGILAIATLEGKEQVNDINEYEYRRRLFARHLSADTTIDLLLAIGRMIDVNRFNDHFGITEELHKKKECTDDRPYAVWGGKTLWGGLIEAVASRYHWTYDQIVWGISYQNLTMLLGDAIGIDYDNPSPAKPTGQYAINSKGNKEIKFSGFNQFLQWVRSGQKENQS